MAIYDYQCQTCGVVQEHIQSVHKRLPDTLPCPRCGKDSEHVLLVAPGVMTGNMSNMTQDVAIGKDAAARWERTLAKRAERDKVRKEMGTPHLTKVGEHEYKPSGKKLEFVETKGTEKYD